MHMSAPVALLGAQLLIPISEVVPTFNVEPSCKAAAAIGLADSQSVPNCMAEENSARRELVSSWQSFRAPDRVRCAAEASSGGIQSYVELLVCLQIASGATPGTTLKGASRKK
jgi:hypothetical protein